MDSLMFCCTTDVSAGLQLQPNLLTGHRTAATLVFNACELRHSISPLTTVDPHDPDAEFETTS